MPNTPITSQLPEDIRSLGNNGTFCVLPWIHDYRTLSGKKFACCVSHTDGIALEEDNNSTSNQQFRLDLWNGTRRKECGPCYRSEDNGIVSYRQNHNNQWLGNPRVQEHIINWSRDSTVTPKLLYWDLRYDSKCNLSCITCGPEFSTLWKKELGIPINEYTLDVDHQDVLDAEKIYFAGGEPLIIDQYTNLMRFLAENNFTGHVSINTNLTSLRQDVVDSIKNLVNVSLIVSVDSWGSVDEYVRYPKRWSKFLDNLATLNDNKIKFSFNTVASAVSVLGWNQLPKLNEFKPDHWFLYAIQTPPDLRVDLLPTRLKPMAKANIEGMIALDHYLNDQKFSSVIDHLLAVIDQDGPTDRLLKRIQELDTRRRINHQDYLGVNLLN
jgi:hypothetical protein